MAERSKRIVMYDEDKLEHINPDTLNTYLSAISNFIKSYEKLGSHYLDHPFYGFNNIKLNQEQYIELRDKIISLSAEFEPCKKAFDSLSKKYNLPYPLNLYLISTQNFLI